MPEKLNGKEVLRLALAANASIQALGEITDPLYAGFVDGVPKGLEKAATKVLQHVDDLEFEIGSLVRHAAWAAAEQANGESRDV